MGICLKKESAQGLTSEDWYRDGAIPPAWPPTSLMVKYRSQYCTEIRTATNVDDLTCAGKEHIIRQPRPTAPVGERCQGRLQLPKTFKYFKRGGVLSEGQASPEVLVPDTQALPSMPKESGLG